MSLTAGFRNTAQVLFTALLVTSLCPTIASADGGAPSELLQRGERAAVAGRCQEALSLLEEARAADPGNSRAALITGQCQLRLKRYAAAEKTLEEARRMKLALPEIDLYLGMARYHLEDYKGAKKALKRALRTLPERAEVNLYVGLLALQRGKSAQAAQSLARAGSADPSAVEPIASFYEGLALEGAGQRMAAADALRRAQKYGQGTEWADHATAALERLDKKRSPPWKGASGRELEILNERSQPWWITTMVGAEFDDNVALRGDDIRIGADERENDDFRLVYSLEAGYEVVATHELTIGLMATYYATAHESFDDFDSHYPGVSTWLDRRIDDKTIARVQYDFGYDFIGDPWVGDSGRFLLSHTWTPAVYHSWESLGDSRAFARVVKNNFFFDLAEVPNGTGVGVQCPDTPNPKPPPAFVPFNLCGPAGLKENELRDRDGWGVMAGFDHTLPVLEDMLIVRGGYRFHYNETDGDDFSYRGHEIQLGGEIRLGHQFRVEGFASYTWLDYLHPSSFPDPDSVEIRKQYGLDTHDRDDDLLRIDITVDRPITNSTSLSARYTYFNSASNADAFDYQRHVVGLYATMQFAP